MRVRNRILVVTALLASTWVAQSPSLAAEEMPSVRPKHGRVTDEDRAFWSFRPAQEPKLPVVGDNGWSRGAIDRFIFARLAEKGLSPAPEADRVTLIRRATFDLHGLPPTPAEVDAFLADESLDAYEKLIDRLLASPRYGERWARHWLDLVRYAESDGFKQDGYRPAAWPYRDYVIKSFNDDKPYDRFVTEQLAGDEIAPDDPNVIVATGYLRHGQYEYNQRDVPKQWSEFLNDITDVTGDALLGLSVGCARCHNHKFDPIPQADYYRLQAFFTPLLPRDDLLFATPERREQSQAALAGWEAKTASIRAEMSGIEAPYVEKTAAVAMAKFPAETQTLLSRPAESWSPFERQIVALARRQMYDPDENPRVKFDDASLKKRHAGLQKQLAAYDAERPTMQKMQVVGDVGPVAPPTFIPGKPDQPLDPGCPTVLAGQGFQLPSPQPSATSTGRRTALAKWITDPANPLTARVIVNRVWQAHFGAGLVATANDFGTLGERPSHPELLDWLARRFVEPVGASDESFGWQFKALHRLMLTSATYRQSSTNPVAETARTKDPSNRLLWRMTPRRLDAEQVRDAMLAASGELLAEAGGPSVDAAVNRRSVYLKVLRNKPDRVLLAFDGPESFCSVATRNTTTTATQSLLMMNGEWPLKRAAAFAARIRREPDGLAQAGQVDAAYRLAFGRRPRGEERDAALAFMTRAEETSPAGAGLDVGLVDLCHVLLSSNEFLYVD